VGVFKESSTVTFVSVRSNKNWILGHWVRELARFMAVEARFVWMPTSLREESKLTPLAKLWPWRSSDFTYMTSPNLYLTLRESRHLEDRAVVLFTHLDPRQKASSIDTAALSTARAIHFMAQHDAESMVDLGLDSSRVRVVGGAVDEQVELIPSVERIPNSVVLSSKYGPRKGAQLLPEIIDAMPEAQFTLIGPGWGPFIARHSLTARPNFKYLRADLSVRSEIYSQARVFLSLSSLEGGPIPLLDAMKCGALPVATRTGFAPDFIRDGENGVLVSSVPKPEEVIEAIRGAMVLTGRPCEAVDGFTWERMARLVRTDFMGF